MSPTHLPIRSALAAAACALLGSAAASGSAAEASSGQPTQVQSGILVYSESKRVTTVETVVNLSKELRAGRILTGQVVFDALTGASPNGATPAGRVQTFTRPSGQGSYQVAAGQTPLDHTFQDTRFAGSIHYDVPLSAMSRVVYGAGLSLERDYSSVGGDILLSRDLFLRNTTVSLGLSGSLDRVSPLGGPPSALSVMSAPTSRHGDDEEEGEGGEGGGGKGKQVAGLRLGLTQVLTPSALMQVNYSAGRTSGYLNDPYKIVSLVDGGPGPNQGEPVRYLYEKRPPSRLQQSLYWLGKGTTGSDVVTLSYRYLWDDWGIRSHTLEARYRWQAREQLSLEPIFRFYRQTAASFYRHSLVDGEPLPGNVSADYRLGAMDAWTTGVKIGHPIAPGRELTLRLEYYLQKGNGKPDDAIGSQRNYDLFPDLRATIVQLGYSMGF
ncbi:MAG: DUF3570 domain-containing protein [Candidatus Eisenbacteria bacterium]|nr:DUF3570 domain-containing protein [Candidatus Eisenbacteria bacterium]